MASINSRSYLRGFRFTQERVASFQYEITFPNNCSYSNLFFVTLDAEDSSHSSSSPMGRTIGIAVGCAGVYILLVIGLMIYCRARRARLIKKGELIFLLQNN